MKYSVVTFLCCFLLFTINIAAGQTVRVKEDVLFRKNFPLLYNIEYDASLSMRKLKWFKEIQQRLERDARTTVKHCSTPSCYSTALQFTDTEIATTGNALVKLALIDEEFKTLIAILKANNAYSVYNKESDTGFVRKAWQADAHGVNYILRTYLEGQMPLYPKIDAISFQKEDPVFRDSITAIVKAMLNRKSGSEVVFKTSSNPYFNIPVWVALKTLLLNGRDEAARYEPLESDSNDAPFGVAMDQKVKWDSFTYSVILVPGLGPEQPDVKLDPGGARRCDSAAVRYYAGLAPFIVVSGGHVHPNKTPYCEAIEMKKYLVNELHIPGSAVIVEPHARHTTTNLRNANRLIFRFAIPASKPVLIVSDSAQTAYINGAMKDKVIKELGYVPFSSIKQVSSTETMYIPSENSKHVNSKDPLDP